MTQVVQATCPHCHQILRIPAEWLDKAMRCKFCRQVFEARPRNGQAPLPATAISAAPVARPATPVARAATAITATPPAAASLVFGHDDTDTGAPHRPRPRRRSYAKLVAGLGCAVMFLIAIPATVVALVVSGVINVNTILMEPPQDDPPELVAEHQPDGDKEIVVAHVGNPKGKGKLGTPKGKDKRGAAKDKKGGPKQAKYGAMPRRALLINVCNYLYLNHVDPGRDAKTSTSLSALKNHGISNAPLLIPPSQIFTLTDEADNKSEVNRGITPHPTELSVIKNAIKDFCDTSRAQDRIIILFAGHATEIEKDCYLIPIGGRKEDADTLIPLTWVYDQLAKCKAQQKVLILDVFRFPPARGFELPGAGASDEGEMGEVFDAALANPPPGVQVWSSCIKGQRSIEFDGGSVFLQALGRVREGAAMTGIEKGENPLAINDAFVAKVNAKMKELIGSGPLAQTSRLTGKPAAATVTYDASEPPAPLIAFKNPVVPAGDYASTAQVEAILGDIRLLPGVRKERTSGEDRLLRAANLPLFPAKTLVKYKPDDGKTLAGLLREPRDGKAREAYAKEHPVRVAVVDAINALKLSEHLSMREDLSGPINDKAKAAFFNEQKEPGKLIFELETVLGDMKQVSQDDLDKETSKRWRAHFDFTQARLKARLVYIYEYSFLLGEIRRDELPPLENGAYGWRMASRKKIKCSEPKAKTYAKEVDKAYKQIQKTYRDTPWEILAYREGLIALGMEWKAKKE
jgi:hypothetical protein